MKKVILFGFVLLFFSCKSTSDQEIKNIDHAINQWHKAAAEADFDTYFNLMTDDAIFIGTDAGENWNKKEFEIYSKPHFDKGKAWTFHSLERNVYTHENQKIAWFDELLDTSFKICRGSGVLEKVNGTWKIKHYVLSMTIPNEKAKDVVTTKDSLESIFIQKLKSKK